MQGSWNCIFSNWKIPILCQFLTKSPKISWSYLTGLMNFVNSDTVVMLILWHQFPKICVKNKMITDFWLCPFDTWIVYNVSCNKCLSWCTKFCDLVEPTNTTIFNEWKWIHNKSQPHQWQVLFIQKSTKSTFFWTLSDHVMMQPLLFQHKRPFQSWVDENNNKKFQYIFISISAC